MGFLIRFFILTVVVLFGRGAHAQCCWCDDPDGCPEGFELISENYGCEQCGGFVYGVDCSYCDPEPPNPCDGYNDPCPFGDAPGKKCKKVGNCPNPCQLYNRCDTTTGAIEQQMLGACHMEGEACYQNALNCKEFNNVTENNMISCSKSGQQGQAEWKPNQETWDTKNCYCNIEHVAIGNEIFGFPWWCDDFNVRLFVSDANRYVTTLVSKDIVYTTERMYCAKCHPGYLPVKVTSPNEEGIYARPDNNAGWGVAACSTRVTKPKNYAEGCVINFNLPDWESVIADCKGVCPEGSSVAFDGATSMDECLPNQAVEYEDATGWFMLGETLCH